MRTPAYPSALAIAAAALSLSLLAGCVSNEVKELPPGAKVIDGNATVLLDAPVGSHMKRKVKVSEMNQPGISPTDSTKMAENTDKNVMPMNADQMQSTLYGGGGTRGR